MESHPFNKKLNKKSKKGRKDREERRREKRFDKNSKKKKKKKAKKTKKKKEDKRSAPETAMMHDDDAALNHPEGGFGVVEDEMLAQDIGEDSEEETFGKFSSNFDAFGENKAVDDTITSSSTPDGDADSYGEIIPTVLPRESIEKISDVCSPKAAKSDDEPRAVPINEEEARETPDNMKSYGDMANVVALTMVSLPSSEVSAQDGGLHRSQIQEFFRLCNERLSRQDDSEKRAKKVVKAVEKMKKKAGEAILSDAWISVNDMTSWLVNRFAEKNPAVLRSFHEVALKVASNSISAGEPQ